MKIRQIIASFNLPKQKCPNKTNVLRGPLGFALAIKLLETKILSKIFLKHFKGAQSRIWLLPQGFFSLQNYSRKSIFNLNQLFSSNIEVLLTKTLNSSVWSSSLCELGNPSGTWFFLRNLDKSCLCLQLPSNHSVANNIFFIENNFLHCAQSSLGQLLCQYFNCYFD